LLAVAIRQCIYFIFVPFEESGVRTATNLWTGGGGTPQAAGSA
jgi:hypothetical protein